MHATAPHLPPAQPPAAPRRGPAQAAQAGQRAGTEVGAPAPLLGLLIRTAAGALLGRIAGQAFDAPARSATPSPVAASRMRRSSVSPRGSYARLKPAYRYGWDSFHRWEGRDFDHVEQELARGWDAAGGDADLPWPEAREAVRDAWMRAREAAALGVFGG